MRAEYDLSKMKSRPNPYAKRLKRQVTIRMGVDVVGYFKQMARETGIPYQSLIDLYLSDCVQSRRKLSLRLGALTRDVICASIASPPPIFFFFNAHGGDPYGS